jgi:RHS repeat-associated protein
LRRRCLTRAANYAPFGTPTGANTFEPRLGYRGELTLDSGLHLRARTYQPAVGQFMSADPAPGIPGTTTIGNRYSYVNNQPNRLIDPLGLYGTGDDELVGNGFQLITLPTPEELETAIAVARFVCGNTCVGPLVDQHEYFAAALSGDPNQLLDYYTSHYFELGYSWDQFMKDTLYAGSAGIATHGALIALGFTPYIGDAMDIADCVSGSTLACSLIVVPIVGARALDEITELRRLQRLGELEDIARMFDEA